jgi:hypothetical protein
MEDVLERKLGYSSVHNFNYLLKHVEKVEITLGMPYGSNKGHRSGYSTLHGSVLLSLMQNIFFNEWQDLHVFI